MHAARADETGVAPRNQQRGGRGGHAGAAAGKPESSDAGIRLRPLFCRSFELGIGLVARPRGPGWKPGSMIHANPRPRAAVRVKHPPRLPPGAFCAVRACQAESKTGERATSKLAPRASRNGTAKPDRPETQHQPQEADWLNDGARCASYALPDLGVHPLLGTIRDVRRHRLTTVLPRLDAGRRVGRHACPGRPALPGFTCVRCCGSPRASIPHALTGKASTVQCRPRCRAATSGFWLPPTGPHKGLSPSIIHLCPTHLRSGLCPPSDTPLGLFPNSLMSTGTNTGRPGRE